MPQPPDRLSASDALLWRIEADPVLRSPIVVVALLDREPAWARVVAGVTKAVDAIPRLRRRITVRDGHPVWEDDPSFRLDHHLRRVRAATPGSLQAALAVAEPDACVAFEPTRPPWTFVLVEGLEGGRAAFVLRFHHAISDGVGAVGLAEHLFDRSRRPSGGARRVVGEPTAERASRQPPALAVAGAAVRVATDPIGTLRGGLRFGRSLTRVLASADVPLSPLLRGRGIDRRLHGIEVAMGDLERAAAAMGGTVNDVYLSAVTGALHRYHEASGVPVAALRFTVPINLRHADDEAGGNRFAPARFVLPVDDPDPVHRARLAGAMVRRWRGEPALGATSIVAEVLDRLPTPALVRLFAGMLRGVDASAVNVPGVRGAAYFAGARVDRLWAFAPPTGAALSVTLVSHGASGCIAVASDTTAVADPELLVRCLESSLDEVVRTESLEVRS